MAHKISVFFFLSFLVTNIWGQDLDSLAVRLERLPFGEARVDMLNHIVTQMRERNIYEIIRYATEAKDMAEKLSYRKGLGTALENLGWIYYRRGIYADAFEMSQDALRISELEGDSLSMARCLNNVAAINYEKANYKDAIERFDQAYKISLRLGDLQTAIRSLNNISFSYLGLKNIDSAEYYAQWALKQSNGNQGSYLPAFSHRILGDIAFEKGDMMLALKHYDEGIRISQAVNNYFIKASTLHRIGKVLAKQKKYTQALEVLDRNVQLSKENGYADELERTYKLISDINYAKDDIEKAFQYLTRHLELHDSLIEQRNSERMNLLSTQFKSDIKQSQIELLTKNAKIREEEIQKQEAWIYFYVGSLVLGLAIALILYYSNLKIKKVNRELEEKKSQVELQAQQLSNINMTKDKLLSIISHDIRSPLSSLRGMLNIAQTGNVSTEEFARLTGQISKQLDFVYEDLGNLLQWTQSQLQGLSVNPETFELSDLADQVISLYHNNADSKKITLVNKTDRGINVLADPNHVRLILRNLLSNAIKFSNENSEVVVANEVTDKLVSVVVRDKGIGLTKDEIQKIFNPSDHFTRVGTAKEKGMGVGLLLTKEFIHKNGGSLSVFSQPGHGSTFSFTLKKAS